MNQKIFLIILVTLSLILIPSTLARSDVSVWQGQYYTGTELQEGTFGFNFTVYDAKLGGITCYSSIEPITTGHWGQWKIEKEGIGAACNNASKDYFLEIIIDGKTQSPRKRLTTWNYLRKDASDTLLADIQIKGTVTSDKQLRVYEGITTPNIFAQNYCDYNNTCYTLSDFLSWNSTSSNQDISTTGTGFFGWLGSLINRITKLFVQDIDASGDVVIGGSLQVNGTMEVNGTVEIIKDLEVGGNLEVIGCIEYNGGTLGTCI